MRRRSFQQVDVFAEMPLAGNPVAVVVDGEGIEADDMARFAHWTNLSETTFLLPPTHPDADYRVRIFDNASGADPARRGLGTELPFAGHPTLGSCHAWLAAGGQPRRSDLIVQECAAGLVAVRRDDDDVFSFAAPPLVRSGAVDGQLLATLARSLRIEESAIVDAAWADNGPGWVAVLLPSAEAVLALRPGAVGLDVGVVGPYGPGAPEAFELRAFYPKDGSTVEDPVTGSLNASVAQWLIASGRATAPYVARQGTALGRSGRVSITVDGAGALWVGGRTVTLITGHVLL